VLDLSISIITIDNKLILDCLQSIYSTIRGISFEIFVVINAAPDSDRIESSILSHFPDVNIIVNSREMGFTHNHNMVMRNCKGKYILLLNDDTLILENAINNMVDYMNNHPDVGVLGCKILNPDRTPQWSCGKSFHYKFEYFKAGLLRTLLSPLVHDQFFNTTQEVNWVTGACMMARTEMAVQVGLMDESIYMYFDDGDWCFRMIRAGWKIVYFNDAEIIHLRSQTSKKIPAKTARYYFMSRLYFFSKHYSPLVLFLVRMLTVIDAVVQYFKMVIISPVHRNKEVFYAYLDGIRLALSSKSKWCYDCIPE
jgi:hypothetical protein